MRRFYYLLILDTLLLACGGPKLPTGTRVEIPASTDCKAKILPLFCARYNYCESPTFYKASSCISKLADSHFCQCEADPRFRPCAEMALNEYTCMDIKLLSEEKGPMTVLSSTVCADFVRTVFIPKIKGVWHLGQDAGEQSGGFDADLQDADEPDGGQDAD